MADQWADVIVACDECKKQYPMDKTEGICPKHKTAMIVAFPPNESPLTITVVQCHECGSESQPAPYSNRGKIGELRTSEPHCPDCGTVNPDLIQRKRGLTDDEIKTMGKMNSARKKIYDHASAYPKAG